MDSQDYERDSTRRTGDNSVPITASGLGDKLACSVDEVKDYGGPGRTTVYAEIAAGRLRARKVGRRTLILLDDLRDWLTALPTLGEQ